jgi:hypothetical protein
LLPKQAQLFFHRGVPPIGASRGYTTDKDESHSLPWPQSKQLQLGNGAMIVFFNQVSLKT